MTITRNTILTYVSLILVACALSACGKRNDGDKAKLTNQRVRIQLQWFGQAQFLGYYVAAQKGMYSKEGLDVEIIPGGYNVNPIERVMDRQAEIGLATANQVLEARGAGHKVKAIGTVFARSLAVFMMKGGHGIVEPKDLIGKKVGVYRGADTEDMLLSLLDRCSIPKSSLTILDAGPLQGFIDNQIQVFPSYVINEPIMMEEMNVPIDLLVPENFGVKFYSDTFFTTEDYWKENRATLSKFLIASAEGWTYACAHQSEALDIMYDLVKTLSKSSSYNHQARMLETACKYLKNSDADTLFKMDVNRWKSMEKSLKSIGKLPSEGLIEQLCDFELIDRRDS